MAVQLLTTARVVLLDDSGRVLLVRCVDPGTGASVWVLPGGSIEPGESPIAAAQRELCEEAGISDVDFGPCVWTRNNQFDHNHVTYRASERVFVAWANANVVPRATGDHADGEIVAEVRWWTPDALDADDADRSPAQLADLIRVLVDEGPPQTPQTIQ